MPNVWEKLGNLTWVRFKKGSPNLTLRSAYFDYTSLIGKGFAGRIFSYPPRGHKMDTKRAHNGRRMNISQLIYMIPALLLLPGLAA